MEYSKEKIAGASGIIDRQEYDGMVFLLTE